MRVTILAPEHPAVGRSFGIGRYLADLHVGLQERGISTQTLVVCAEGHFKLGDGEPLRCGNSHRFGFRRPQRARAWVEQELAKHATDLVITSNWGGLGCAIPAGPALVVHCSSSIDDHHSSGLVQQITWTFHRRNEQRTLERAECIIANSTAMAKRTQDIYGLTASHVIPHAYRGPIVSAPSRGTDALFVGRFEHRKGIDTLLAVWSQTQTAAHLHVVGSGSLPTPPERVTVHGSLSDVQLDELRRRCSVQLVPSRWESFGLVVLEAWAAGLVPLTSDAGGLPEVVADGGICVPAGDTTALANSIDELLANEVKRSELWHHGHTLLQQRYAADVVLDQLLAAYASVASHRP